MNRSLSALLLLSVVLGCKREPPPQDNPEHPEAPKQPPTGEPTEAPPVPWPAASQAALAPAGTDAAQIPRSGPPISLTASDGSGLRMVSFKARAVVEDPLAFTELQLSFQNPQPRQIEGQFEITLPQGATISRFAMRQGDSWQEGEVVELQAAREAYEDFLHRRQDPALLEKQAGNQFHARVFPIPPSGMKELIVSYSQERTREADPFRIYLRGLPRLDQLDIRALIGKTEVQGGGSSLGGTTVSHQSVEVQKTGFTPDTDFEVAVPAASGGNRLGLRHDNLVVARITPISEARQDPLTSVLVLFDTSASRALGFQAQVDRLGALIGALREQGGGKLPLRVACFDQEVEEVFAGPASDFGSKQLARISERRALGASDLGKALSFVVARQGTPYERVVLMTDGIATAGKIEGSDLQKLAQGLRGGGVKRLDVVAFGGIRDEALLSRLVTAGLPSDGVVADGDAEAGAIMRKLGSATLSGIKVTVPGSQWTWPTQLDGIQPGDQVLIYADLPGDRPFEVVLEGAKADRLKVVLARVARPLLERAWVNARIHKLMHQRDTLAAGDQDLREGLRHQIIELSTRFRVLSDFTALLVLETEQDYARFHLDRRALTDILTVGPTGIEVINRRQAVAQQVPVGVQPSPEEAMINLPKSKLQAREEHLDRLMAGKEDPERARPLPPPAPRPMASGTMAEKPMAAAPLGVAAGGAPAPPPAEGPALDQARSALEEERRQVQLRTLREQTARQRRESVALAPPHPSRMPPRRIAPRLLAPPNDPLSGLLALGDTRQPEVAPYEGQLLVVMNLLKQHRDKDALHKAQAWRDQQPGDVLALIALGEALEALGQKGAARAYGSLIDLFPSRADLRRFAGERLERLGAEGLGLAVDSFAQARAQRPDHPASHRLLAFALLRAGHPDEAFAVISEGAHRDYPPGRFAGVPRILLEDVGLIGAAWIEKEPEKKQDILGRVAAAGATVPEGPSLRFVLNWETDANDVDFHIHDGQGGHAFYSQRALPSGGELYADVTTGYGPECFTIEGPPRAYPYKLQAHYYSRGPMGYGMGKLEIIEHDGKGHLRFAERPFVIMADNAFVDLGTVTGPLPR